ncbi:MAG: RNA-binding cell elongation regulator Jag/EloR [Candidatus Hydrogenedentota bacterium]
MQLHEEGDQRDRVQGTETQDAGSPGSGSSGSVEIENKLLEDAIAEGLARLGITRDKANIEILDEGKGGFLGIGAKNARVRVSRIDNAENIIKDVLSKLLESLDENATVAGIKLEDGRYHCEVNCENIALLLGRRGRTLDAIQSLLAAIASRKLEDHVRVMLDSGGFREKRKEVLTQMAQDAARDAIELKEEIHLEPMSSHDRKLIHACLSANPEIRTMSEDTGDRRHIVVLPADGSGKKSQSRGSEDRPREGRGGRGGRSGGRSGRSDGRSAGGRGGRGQGGRGGRSQGGRSSGGGRGRRSSSDRGEDRSEQKAPAEFSGASQGTESQGAEIQE